MLRVIDVVYYYHKDITDPAIVLEKHRPALGFAEYFATMVDLQMIKHLNYEGKRLVHGVSYRFFRSRNSFWYIPFKTHRYIKSQKPDVVIVEGLVFPLQLIALKLLLGRKCRIIAQHHGVDPFPGLKGWLQKIADRYVDIYLFSSIGNASEW